MFDLLMMPPDPHLDEQDALWRLLGRAPRITPDPWFTVRTLARCRYEEKESLPLRAARAWRWILGVSGGLAFALFLLLVPHEKLPAMAAQPKAQEAFEVLASIDTSDPDSWSDSNSL